MDGVVALPVAATAGATGAIVKMTLLGTTVLAASGGQAVVLAVLVHSVADPVDARIAADGLVGGVHKDDLVELVGRVLGNPVRVEDAETAALPANTLLQMEGRKGE